MPRKLPPVTAPPRKERPRRAGLEQLLDAEPKTLKRQPIKTLPAEEPCPACSGSTFESIQQLDPPEVDTFRVVQCSSCGGRGKVSPEEAARISAALSNRPTLPR